MCTCIWLKYHYYLIQWSQCSKRMGSLDDVLIWQTFWRPFLNKWKIISNVLHKNDAWVIVWRSCSNMWLWVWILTSNLTSIRFCQIHDSEFECGLPILDVCLFESNSCIKHMTSSSTVYDGWKTTDCVWSTQKGNLLIKQRKKIGPGGLRAPPVVVDGSEGHCFHLLFGLISCLFSTSSAFHPPGGYSQRWIFWHN